MFSIRSENGCSCTLSVCCVFGFVLETLPVGDIARACLPKRYVCFKSVVYSDYGGRGDKSRVSDYCCLCSRTFFKAIWIATQNVLAIPRASKKDLLKSYCILYLMIPFMCATGRIYHYTSKSFDIYNFHCFLVFFHYLFTGTMYVFNVYIIPYSNMFPCLIDVSSF